MKENTTIEIRHYKDVVDENVKQMLTEVSRPEIG